ncbi:MAG: carbohydrate kinase family protein [Candidatus Paceibacterota bacterium]
MTQKIDFLSVGDITTDAFVDIDDARIDTDKDEGDKGFEEICFRFGDKIEYEDLTLVSAVGNAPNAAVSAHRLGLKTGLLTNLGDDTYGQKCVETLKEEGISDEYIQVHEGKSSNFHIVLRFGPERTILVKHEVYPYSLPEDMDHPEWIYLSSLGSTSLEHHHEIAQYLKEHDEIKFAFQPGTFQMELGYEKLKDVYEVSTVFFANKEEYQRILETDEGDIPTLLETMHERGPKIAVLTDGPNGAYTYDGSEKWSIPMYPDPKPPVDRTGAGDSFSSTFTTALALGNDIPTALSWGPINSMSVVQYIGAQEGLLTREKLEEYLQNAPEDYTPQKLS